jgi:anti-anti-sigma regulatory factor
VDHISLGHTLVELATNVVKHAYRDAAATGQPIMIEAVLDETGVVVATVTDRGRWRIPEDPHGRGLTMAGGLMDSVHVRHTPHGTEVEARSRLGRPVQLWQADRSGFDLSGTRGPDELSAVAVSGHLTAAGPVDEASAELFHAALTEATHAGTTAATVDLTEVTHLSSPGVQSLFDFLQRSTRSGVSMSIVAPKSTPARQILDLVGLPAGP